MWLADQDVLITAHSPTAPMSQSMFQNVPRICPSWLTDEDEDEDEDDHEEEEEEGDDSSSSSSSSSSSWLH